MFGRSWTPNRKPRLATPSQNREALNPEVEQPVWAIYDAIIANPDRFSQTHKDFYSTFAHGTSSRETTITDWETGCEFKWKLSYSASLKSGVIPITDWLNEKEILMLMAAMDKADILINKARINAERKQAMYTYMGVE